jgi:uncharacterized protein YceH (UPF0502 family)
VFYWIQVDFLLDSVELRTLGALIEKESTTPEYYPLTLNALVAACNQKSNRWPVADYEDHEVQSALSSLRAKGFSSEITGGSRVAKYAQRFTEKLNLGRRETAILCVLMLRGQQTLGEIKGRTERFYAFSDLDEVEMVLHKLMERAEGPLTQKLAPAPGMKEPRYAQTLAGLAEQAVAATAPGGTQGIADRVGVLETEVSELRAQVEGLRRLLESVM